MAEVKIDIPAFDPVPTIAQECELPERGVAAVVKLLGEGSTVPFIARYRKEMTGSLDEVQIRTIQERHGYLVELDERKKTVLTSISEQGKLTEALKAKILACSTKAILEDLYLPYKPKRRTRATIAKEKGLEPLADVILQQPAQGDPMVDGQGFVSEEKGVPDAAAALAGARDIIAEMAAENAEIRAAAREAFAEHGEVVSEPVPEKATQPTKYEQYYNYAEAVKTIPSHRFLAVRRGEREGILRVRVNVDPERTLPVMRDRMGMNKSSPYAAQMEQALADSYTRLLAPSVETDIRVELKQRSDRQAVDVFAENLRNLLLAAPMGSKAVIAIDPGLRTGCKCVALSQTGKFLGNTTIYIARGEAAQQQAKAELLAFMARHEAGAVAIGNGTGGRETEAFVRVLLRETNLTDMIVVQVNESGASVYSASDVAREEFPDLDLTVRGAISIGRRLQDPLAELVKIDPKSIGVGQYQHDVHQPLLQRKLEEVVESCVNHVGVELNTASAPLLSQVAGIGPALAKRIVERRDGEGAFKTREELLSVGGMGPRTFEQAAGFLRIRGASNPLDSSAVHPERYNVVASMARDLEVELTDLVGNAQLASKIDITKYVSDDVGEPTLRDIIAELQKPGRDPRASFEPPKFRDDVFELEHLKVDMTFEGVVTNVTNFGAFVDIGVHQDGLVHISELSDRFVKDPNEVVKVGDRLKVRVLDVDLERRRISLSAKSGEAARPRGGPNVQNATDSGRAGAGNSPGNRGGSNRKSGRDNNRQRQQKGFSNNPFANLRIR